PTRSSVLTGRYNYRTGIVDTYIGRSLMRRDEVTLAERLARAGYRTGIFGKWHLGDNLPLRPIDRGFQEALVLKGGGIGQPSDLPGGSHYHDPVLLKNGQITRYSGYCSDIYTTAAIDFINASADRPFFLYLPFNCPHDPLEAPEPELSSYLKEKEKLGRDQFAAKGYPLPSKLDVERIAKLYAMVTNIDTNVGRLLKAVAERGIAGSTIVVFLTDNGPAFARYNAGLHGLKGTTYEGGIHVPCFIRWPGHFPAGRELTQAAAHIDLVPTLLEACQVPAENGPKLDGRSLLPLLRGESISWPERTLYFQWHRGDVPEFGRAFGARAKRFKLLRPEQQAAKPHPPLELYDLEKDPFEQQDIAKEHPEIVARMYHDYLDWFRDVCSRGFGPIRIQVGDARENPTLLTRQDWHLLDERAQGLGGFWELEVTRPGRYEIILNVGKSKDVAHAHVRIQNEVLEQSVATGTESVVFHKVSLVAGPARLHAWLDGSQPASRVRDAQITWISDK
ncbi:MAG: arylsulfatase, partial [Isosphaeraceae bacterium]